MLRNEFGLTQAEFAEKMRRFYPACSSTAVSLAERSETSGVKFTEEFVKTAQSVFRPLKKALHGNNRKHNQKVSFWTDDEQREWLAEKDNIGEYLRGLIAADIKKAAVRVGAQTSGKKVWSNPSAIIHK